LAALTVVTILAGVKPGLAQHSEDLTDLRKDVDALKEGQKAIQGDVTEIKRLLRARPSAAAPPSLEAVVSIEGAQVKGDNNAKVTIVDFTDYQ